MATVLNVKLNVGKSSTGREFAEVSYDIRFSTFEVAHNLNFDEHVRLWDRDDGLDRYYRGVGSPFIARQQSEGNSDDLIGLIHAGTIRPNGSTIIHRKFRAEWDFGGNESGPEEYRALVDVVPEVGAASAWSQEAVLNLG